MEWCLICRSPSQHVSSMRVETEQHVSSMRVDTNIGTNDFLSTSRNRTADDIFHAQQGHLERQYWYQRFFYPHPEIEQTMFDLGL